LDLDTRVSFSSTLPPWLSQKSRVDVSATWWREEPSNGSEGEEGGRHSEGGREKEEGRNKEEEGSMEEEGRRSGGRSVVGSAGGKEESFELDPAALNLFFLQERLHLFLLLEFVDRLFDLLMAEISRL